MPQIDSEAGLDRLWQDWQAARAARSRVPGLEVLRALLADRGTRLTRDELHAAFAHGHGRPVLSRARLADGLVPLLGGRGLRLAHAFDYLARGAGQVPVDRLRAALAPFVDDAQRLEAMLGELDADGDLMVTLADFDAFHPDTPPPAGAYRASHLHPDRRGTAPPGPPPAAPPPPAPPPGAAGQGGIAPVQMQIGFFRLLQGAAYRSFRRNWAANSETHLRAHDLPYTVADFTEFVRATVALYLSLGLVTGDRARQTFRDLVALVEAEETALAARIAGWGQLAKPPGMAAAAARAAAEGAALADHRAGFARAVELLLALRQAGVPPEKARPEALDRHELTRLRHLEVQAEHAAPAPAPLPEADFHASWASVIPSGQGSVPPGALMPVAFWYDRFQPQLLLCASILSDVDLDAEMALDAAALDAWHAEQADTFRPYADDLALGFAACPVPVKRALRQAWRLTAPYLNGVEKQRERAEFGRGSGALSQYVAFVDLHLGRSDVAAAEMRLSFPYYIGPATWCFLHTAAELIEAMDPAPRAAACAAFARFFRALATMYPCPYCRYHLNRYVAPNRERQFYPVEFLILGQRPDRAPLEISLDDRLATLAEGQPGALRLFVWKLHNAVSSSIARTEEWYHRDSHPLYTTRYWPGLGAEIARLRALGQDHIALDRAEGLEAVTRSAARLAILREGVHAALEADDHARLGVLLDQAAADVAAAEGAVEASGLLQAAYRLDPGAGLPAPGTAAALEGYARSGRFIER